MRLATGIAAVLLVLAATVVAIIAIFTLSNGAWIGAAIIGGLAAALYVVAYWLYLLWRRLTRAADKEQQRASAK